MLKANTALLFILIYVLRKIVEVKFHTNGQYVEQLFKILLIIISCHILRSVQILYAMR